MDSILFRLYSASVLLQGVSRAIYGAHLRVHAPRAERLFFAVNAALMTSRWQRRA